MEVVENIWIVGKSSIVHCVHYLWQDVFPCALWVWLSEKGRCLPGFPSHKAKDILTPSLPHQAHTRHHGLWMLHPARPAQGCFADSPLHGILRPTPGSGHLSSSNKLPVSFQLQLRSLPAHLLCCIRMVPPQTK